MDTAIIESVSLDSCVGKSVFFLCKFKICTNPCLISYCLIHYALQSNASGKRGPNLISYDKIS